MSTEKPKVTLPLQVGQKVIWNYGKGGSCPGRVVLTDLRNQDQCSVLVAYGDEDAEYITTMRPDGTKEGLWGEGGEWLTDPPDPSCVEQESTMSMADKLKLIAEWAPLNHEGSRDIALFYSNSPRCGWVWRCDVGNRHPYVMLGEVDGELTTFGDTPEEAVNKMLEKLALYQQDQR